MSWKMAPLGDLADVQLGKMLDRKKNQGECRRYLGNDNVQWNQFKFDEVKEMRIKDSERERYGIRPGDLLICEGGDPGRCALWTSDEEMYYQKALNRVRVYDGIDPRYLLYYFLHIGATREVAQYYTGGATIKHLPNAALKRVEVRYPDLETQRRIASILMAYDNLIENNRRQIALLEEAAQRLYREWVVDLRFPGHENVEIVDGVPQGWRVEKLPHFAHIQYGFAFKSAEFNEDGKGLPIVRIRNVPTGRSSDYTTEIADERYLVNDGDVLIGMDGDFYINAWHGGIAWLVQRSCCVRPTEEAYTGYIEQALRMPVAAYQQGIVGATVAHLGKKHLDTIDVLIPPVGLCLPIMTMAKQRLILNKQIDAAEEARKRLLPKLMSGEIEVEG